MLRLRSRRTRLLCGASLLVCAVLAATGWRSFLVSWQLSRARAALSFGDSDDVASALNMLKAAKGVEQPDRPELLYLLGRAHRRAGNVDDALDYLSAAEQAGWPAAQVSEQRQLAFFQRGRFPDDGFGLNQLLMNNESDEAAYEIYESIAKGYLFSYRLTDAQHCLDFWIDWQPEAIEPRLMRASIWDQMRNWERAKTEYGEILSIDPAHQPARLALAGIMLLQLNQVADAEREFRRCLENNPDDVNALLGIASCARRLAEPKRAEECLTEVLSRELTLEQRASAQLELGQVLMDRGELDAAGELLLQVVEDDPLNSTAHYSMGMVHAAKRQPEQAAAYFAKSKELQEEFSRLTDITVSLASDPANPELRWEAGRILMKQGMHREGAAWMSTALMYDSNHQKTHESLAWYYETIKPDQRLAEHHRLKAGTDASHAVN